jgi:uncharacterized protein (DUF2225 family)
MSDAARKITFFSKSQSSCPVCEAGFLKEELLSGGGRLIAGELTEELHRTFEPSKKFGEVHPLIYTLTVCPACHYAAFPQDFDSAEEEVLAKLRDQTKQRTDSVALIFSDLNFAEYRRLEEGIASYYLAMMCYEHFTKRFSPTFKRGLSALRAAWLLEALHHKNFGENYDYLARLFYRKARFFYLQAVELAQNGREPLDSSIHVGPDLDKNYGFEGFLYIAGLLEFRYGPRKDRDRRIRSLETARRIVAKLFGTGRVSKSRPSAILDKSRELYERMSEEIKSLQAGGG